MPASASAKPAASVAASASAKPVASGAAETKPAASASASASPVVFSAGAAPSQANASCNGQMRKITLGVSVAPPNVVHTPPFVARALGIFAKRCIEADIVQFEGGLSQTNITAVARGSVMSSLNEVAIGQGIKAHQVWGMAPRPPQEYVVGPDIKTAADLKGKKLSAAGGGVGSFNWVMGREVLKTAGLSVNDAQFISQGTAGRLPGLVSGQIDGVALHPEDVYLAEKQKPGVHVLVNLSELLPLYFFNAYGVADDFANRDHKLVVDTAASLIEANRAIYQQRDKVIPVMVQATEKPREGVEFAYESLTKGCIWSVNAGFNRERTEWSIQNSVANGDIDAGKKPTFEQVVDEKLGNEALTAAGGPTTIGSCKD
ncbi:MAG TPA: ABC transporter substrate-binding protein [Chloroflexota bacterium]|nr:ABC transporter substrate-binding protein [Chloroflexota bacterium]